MHNLDTITKDTLSMNYFKDCKTIFEAKAHFRELAKKYHPDCGGDAKTFAEISNQMDAFNPTRPEHTNSYQQPHQRAYNSYGAKTTYTFNRSVPFDHPIHEELRQARNNIDILTSESIKNLIEKERKCQELREKVKWHLRENGDCYNIIRKQEDEISSLKAQIEVLSREKPPKTIMENIRSYFEKLY